MAYTLSQLWILILWFWNNESCRMSWDTITNHCSWWSKNIVKRLPLIFKSILGLLIPRKIDYLYLEYQNYLQGTPESNQTPPMIFLGLYNTSYSITTWKLFLTITIKEQLNVLFDHFSPHFYLIAHFLRPCSLKFFNWISPYTDKMHQHLVCLLKDNWHISAEWWQKGKRLAGLKQEIQGLRKIFMVLDAEENETLYK